MFCSMGDDDPFSSTNPSTARCVRIADVQDGTSNSIMMGERVQSVLGSNRLQDGPVAHNLGDTGVHNNPSECLAKFDPTTKTVIGGYGSWAGVRWVDGSPPFTGMTTILGPNQGSCVHNTWDGDDGIFEPSSRHPGGAQVVLGDAKVTMVSENIDHGNISAAPVTGGKSPYGVWGALGSIAGGDIARVP